jgi:hypothetical protein
MATHGTVSVYVTDNASPWLEWAARTFPKHEKSALESMGNWMRGVVKAGMKAKAPGGKPWVKARMKTKKRTALEHAFGNKGKGRYPVMGRLAATVKYHYIADEHAVIIGPDSASGYKLFNLHESGYTRRVTGKMRRAYAAAGIPLASDTDYIHTRARPTWEPVWQKYHNQFAPMMEDKIWGYLNGNTSRSAAKTRRKYKVYRMW